MEPKVIEAIRNVITDEFDTTFIDSLEKRIQMGKHLTDKQEAALTKIYTAVMSWDNIEDDPYEGRDDWGNISPYEG